MSFPVSFPGVRRPLICAAVAGVAATAGLGAVAAETCTAKSSTAITPVVELYTSEGCNSCPPADRWLSKLKAEPNVVALAFHVDYWDRLGWKDRFASAAYSERQAVQQRSNGARFSYTPQVVVNGRDRPDWPSVAKPMAASADAPVQIELSHDGDRVNATVAASPRAPKRLAAYWAVTEQGYKSDVRAGENEGVTLHHDFVVRDYKPVAAWITEADAPRSLSLDLSRPADAAHPRQVNLVIVDADSGKPVQALKIGC